MKLKPIYVQVLIIVVLIFIAANQTIWISNMYNLYKQELVDLANQSAEKAVFMELAERSEIMGGYRVFSTNISNPNDTSRYFTKKVRTEDSTYLFTIDKHDPNIMNKIIQFVYQKDYPINLRKLNTLFKEELSSRYPIKNTYFDYLNLQNRQLIGTNRPKQISPNYLATDTIPLDIISSIGIIGYVEVPNLVILRKMGYQLALSVLLILIGMGGMVYLGKSFVIQWRLEKHRQESVNAMTHEFKRPISGAVAMVALIPFYAGRKDMEKVTDYANNTLTELNKLTAYTERIQQISNNEKGNIVLNKEPIIIKSFFEAIKERYTSQDNEAKKVAIQLNTNTEKAFITADLIHFSNVMDNLVENAIKYSTSDVTLYISISDIKEGLKIAVEDNGIGISPYDLKFIFDKFYRSNRKEIKNKAGFGLGLTYVKSIVEAHGGTITAESKLNEGSKFTVELRVES
ncbi:MAG: HAMP domain-containing sensor histidine kinase [Paludibacter sp.]|nr:HAMP domain-containing sensor histidine kinase [Paludibacter sp.]